MKLDSFDIGRVWFLMSALNQSIVFATVDRSTEVAGLSHPTVPTHLGR